LSLPINEARACLFASGDTIIFVWWRPQSQRRPGATRVTTTENSAVLGVVPAGKADRRSRRESFISLIP
jgi:hypothetical protein